MSYKKLWIVLAIVFLGSFAVLGYYGGEIYQTKPPIPEKVVTSSGQVLYTKEMIQEGQNIWQRMGGQQVGSVWGHGAYVAPDWTADRLHREAEWLLNMWANADYKTATYQQLTDEQLGALKARLKKELRTNTYDEQKDQIVISADRAKAAVAIDDTYSKLFGDDPSMNTWREEIAVPANTVVLADDRAKMDAFFWWATWATETNRPGSDITYTSNWPGEPLIDNAPTSSAVLWSVASVIMMLAGVGALAWYFAVQRGRPEEEVHAPERDPLLTIKATPSMKATYKFFWLVVVLILVQVGVGALTAHYAVEGNGFFGIPLAKWFPYSVTRTWHEQLAIFWIATAWLATGLYIGPAISGKEPKGQRFLVNFLFVALLLIVVGSMAGQWAAIKGYITNLTTNFYFGHQGYEYVDLGRVWQILLAVGLFLWFFLMARALWPALKSKNENKHLLSLFLLASLAIPVFYLPSLMWNQTSHLTVATYWRWWVVHLWVEGFFEVFAAVVMAFLFSRMGLIKTASATASVLFSTIIFLFGGIIGTFHHLYFAGTPTGVLVFGAVFSAFEVVPLVLIGFEAYENVRHGRAKPWVQRYKWPIYFFISVAFWNLLGAGIFGFLINPPIMLYYTQGLNLTPLHGHTALFGVYGMLGIGLMLFCLRGLTGERPWKTKLLGYSFWAFNLGLLLMGVTSLLPVGIMQAVASVSHGMWYARSAEFLHKPIVQDFIWFRMLGDTIFTFGVVGLIIFVVGLKSGHSYVKPAGLTGIKRVEQA